MINTTKNITYKFRIKDSSCKGKLRKLANAVNFVWNYCNETSYKAIKNHSRWMSGYDFAPLVRGCGKDLGLHSQTVQTIAQEFAAKRNQYRKLKLRWRKSSGSKRSLGWIPLGRDSIKLKDNSLLYLGKPLKFWKSREVEGKVKCGSINEDARGRWYLNLICEVEDKRVCGESEIGLDLGLKTFACDSNGMKYNTGKWYRSYEDKLAKAQKKKHKKLIKTIYAKITNKRRDELHKLSDKLVKENKLIVVGNVNSSKLAKTNMAKSVLDASWSAFRIMLNYKAIRRHGMFIVVNENNTTITCNSCGTIPESAPRGVRGLGIREWGCSNCGSSLDRDTNAAINILRLGHQTLCTEGSQELKLVGDVKLWTGYRTNLLSQ